MEPAPVTTSPPSPPPHPKKRIAVLAGGVLLLAILIAAGVFGAMSYRHNRTIANAIASCAADKDQANCFGKAAVNLKYPSLCQKSSYPNACYFHAAQFAQDITYCNRIIARRICDKTDCQQLYECYGRIAYAKKDASLCEAASSKSDATSCKRDVLSRLDTYYLNLARADRDGQHCNKIADLERKRTCLIITETADDGQTRLNYLAQHMDGLSDMDLMELGVARLDTSVCGKIKTQYIKTSCLNDIANKQLGKNGPAKRQEAAAYLQQNGMDHFFDCLGPLNVTDATLSASGTWVSRRPSGAPIGVSYCNLSPDRSLVARMIGEDSIVIAGTDGTELWSIKPEEHCRLYGWSQTGKYLVTECGTGPDVTTMYYDVKSKRQLQQKLGYDLAWLDADHVAYQKYQNVPTPLPVGGGVGYGVAIADLASGTENTILNASSFVIYHLNGARDNGLYYTKQEVKETSDFSTRKETDTYWKMLYPDLTVSSSDEETNKAIENHGPYRQVLSADITKAFPSLEGVGYAYYDFSPSHPTYALFTCESGHVCFADLAHPETKAAIFESGKAFWAK